MVTLTILDLILIILLSGCVFFGLFLGLIRSIGLVLGAIAGAWAASHYYLSVFNFFSGLGWGERIFEQYGNLVKIVCFFLIFSLINWLVGWIFSLVEKSFNLISFIPLVPALNRLAGAALGFIFGCLVLGLFIFMLLRYPILAKLLSSQLLDSKLVPFLLKIAGLISPLLPEILRSLKAMI